MTENVLKAINSSIQNEGATHILTVSLPVGCDNSNCIQVDINNWMDHKVEVGGKSYIIKWCSNVCNDTVLSFYTVTELSDIIIHAHTRNLLKKILKKYMYSSTDKEEINYTITKTTGFIDKILVKDL